MALLLFGCTTRIQTTDGVVIVESSSIANTIVVETQRTNPVVSTTDADECKHFGYCLSCGLMMGGKFKCGMGFFYNCPGKRSATISAYVVTTQTEYHLKSGRVIKATPQSTPHSDYVSVGVCR